MEAVVPAQFFFRWAFACQQISVGKSRGSSAISQKPNGLAAKHKLSFLGIMDRQAQPFDLAIGWSATGLVVQVETRQKTRPIVGEPDQPNQADSLALWIDTRDTRQIHRATPFCQHYIIGLSNKVTDGVPFVTRHSIPRANEQSPVVDLSGIKLELFTLDDDGDWVATTRTKDVSNYRLVVTLPAAAMHGFDPEVNRRLGFFYRVRDSELGDQLLLTGKELPYWEDPSLWATLELV